MSMRSFVVLFLLTGGAFAQSGVPTIAREGLTERKDGRLMLYSPGMITTFYGANLGPEPTCFEPIPQNGPYPTESCGVRVLVDGRPAGLLYVGPHQTNFKIPDEAPEEGLVPVRVCVREVCSDPVVLRFSLRKAYIHLQGHAYVNMPVWLEVNQPWGDVHYPAGIMPLDLGRAKFEVFHKGEPLAPAQAFGNTLGMGMGAAAGLPSGRLPLHLHYRFEEPGVYSVRFHGIGYQYPGAKELAIESDWTDIVVEPYTAAQRSAWLASEAVKARMASAGELVGDIIPSLLAQPDQAALAVLMTMVDHPDGSVRQFARFALTLFPEDVQRRLIPASRWSELHSFEIG